MYRVISLLAIVLSFSACSGGSTPSGCDNSAQPSYLYRSGTTHLEVYSLASCSFQPLFIKGVNLGIATPGKYAGDLETAATKADFLRWFQLMTDAGINVVRVYTLHMDFFYDALYEFNTAREANGLTPLYLSQGIWLDEEYEEEDINENLVIDPDEFRGLYANDLNDKFSTNINEVVHAVHGNIELSYVDRPGKAYGIYVSDVSKWVLAWIIGREVHPDEVELTNDGTPAITSYSGTHLSLPSGSPTEAWITANMDAVVSLEKSAYDDERPISFSSWPTLDPLSHSTETGTPVWEDYQQVDLNNIDSSQAPAGVFYSFHAYPYYPDFISEDPDYRTYTDSSGGNSYVGYLTALKNHYSGRPVIIAEFSVPSSWGSVHSAHSGMHHGGHDETTQGLYGARMLQNIHDTNMGGGMLFAWMDEWWKPTWLTNEFDFSTQKDGSNNLINRRAYWHNIMAPEQNYGLIGFIPDPLNFNTLTKFDTTPWAGPNITTVSAAADTTYYRLKLGLNAALNSGNEIIIAIDTYDDTVTPAKLGETQISNAVSSHIGGTPLTTLQGSEFLLRIFHDGSNWQAQLYVGSDYDLYGLYGGTPVSNLRSPTIPTDIWKMVKWKTNYTVYTGIDRDSVAYSSFYSIAANTEFNAGALKVRDVGASVNSKDAVMLYNDRIEIRLPWSLLQFSDPSQQQVFHDDSGIPDTQDSLTTTGIAQAIIFNGGLEGETNRYLWNTWFTDPTDSYLPFADQLEPIPTYTETVKQSYTIYKNAIANIGN